MVDEQRGEHAHLHHGEETHACAEQHGDQERRKRKGADEIELGHAGRIVGGPMKIDALDDEKIEPDRAQGEEEFRIRAPCR